MSFENTKLFLTWRKIIFLGSSSTLIDGRSGKDKRQGCREAAEKGSSKVAYSAASSKSLFTVCTIQASLLAGSIMSSELVRKLQLLGKATVMLVKVVEERRTIKQTSIYKIHLLNMQGRAGWKS